MPVERDPATGRLFRGDPTGRSDKGRAHRAARRGPVVAAVAAMVLGATAVTVWLFGVRGGADPAPAAASGTTERTTTAEVTTEAGAIPGSTSGSTGSSTTETTTSTTTTTSAAELPPIAPAGLSATPADATTIGLTWQDLSTNETAFEVDDGQVTRTVAADVQELVWDGLAPGQEACFRVRAVGDAGASAWQPEISPFFVCATTPQRPSQPAAAPDLVAQGIELLSSTEVCTGSSPTFQASASNDGSAPSDDFLVRWVADGEQPADEPSGGLAPQAADKYQFTWAYVPAGKHQLAFTVDADGRITELDEGNNGSVLSFTAVDCSTG